MQSQPHILVVDDDQEITTLLCAYLARFGFHAHAAADADAMRAQLARQSIDLVVLDLMLPGTDGLALAREVRARSALPIIMLTARTSPYDRVLGLEMGADDYMDKPFEPRELVARIQSVLRRTHLRGTASPEPRALLDVEALVQSLADDQAELGQPVAVQGHASPLHAQAGALRRAVVNLVENAVRYGGDATIRLRDTREALAIEVRDHGPGLAEAELQRVLEPFYRADGSRHRDHGGVGLGLSIARDIAQRHGGSLTLVNAEGGGLLATVWLPR